MTGEKAASIFNDKLTAETIITNLTAYLQTPLEPETVQLYISGILTAKEAVERLRHSEVNNQVSFHTKKAIKYLKLVRREVFDGMLHV